MTTNTARRLITLTLPMLAMAAPQMAHAAGFYLQEQSVKAAGRAFSGEVADQGAESLWWNPAAIGGQEGLSVSLGMSAILPKGTMKDGNTLITFPGHSAVPLALTGAIATTVNDPLENGYLPSGAIAYGVNKHVALGLTITSPYSFTTNYGDNTWVSLTAGRTRLRTYDIQPSIAFAPNGELSIGVGVNVERSVATLTNYLPNLGAGPDGQQMLHGTGWDLGVNVGAQWHRGPISLGVSFKSAVKHHLDGSLVISGILFNPASNATISTQATFTTPWQVTFGGRYEIAPGLTLNMQAVRFGWAKFDQITLGAPVNQALPENYRNTWSYALGADWAVTSRWTLRAGMQHDMTPTQDPYRDARVPDGNRWNIGAGTSYALTQRFTFDLAANYIGIQDSNINKVTAVYAGTAAQTVIAPNGTLTGAHVVVLSVGARAKF